MRARRVPFRSLLESHRRTAGKSGGARDGRQIAGEQGVTKEVIRRTTGERSGAPFNNFPGVDLLLGPEMRSIGK
ncbi:hypothetical protein ACLK17_00270 [Escherichia coli]